MSIDDLLAGFIDIDIKPFVQDGEYDYFVRFVRKGVYQLQKLDGSKLAASYIIRVHGKQITCTCDAGKRGIECKHKIWLRPALVD